MGSLKSGAFAPTASPPASAPPSGFASAAPAVFFAPALGLGCAVTFAFTSATALGFASAAPLFASAAFPLAVLVPLVLLVLLVAMLAPPRSTARAPYLKRRALGTIEMAPIPPSVRAARAASGAREPPSFGSTTLRRS